MGFFSKVFGGDQPLQIKDEREGFISVLIACMSTDGSISDDEITSLIITLATRNMFRDMDKNMVKRCAEYMKKAGGPAALVEAAVPSISADKKEALFFYSVDIVLADGVVTREEEEILVFIKDKLGISDDVSRKIVEVCLIKNKI